MSDYHVTMLTRAGAETWTRVTRGIPDHVGIGWRPYRFLVTRGAISVAAFHKGADLKRWLSAHGVKVTGVWRRNNDVPPGPENRARDYRQRTWAVGILRLSERG